MNIANKVYCDMDLVRFVKEDQLLVDGVPQTLSITCCGDKYELMVFLEKDNKQNMYEVRVYKREPSQGCVIHINDKFTRYGENADFATFGFEEFMDAIEFLDTLTDRHPEYCARPLKIRKL